MESRDDQPPAIRYSIGAPPESNTPALPQNPATQRSSVPGVKVGAVALILAVGFGAGYLIFHKDVPSTPKSPKEAFQAWYEGGGKLRIDEFTTDTQALTAAASDQDTVRVRAACVSLQATVESAQAYQPFPDAQAQAPWASALAAYARGAADCIAGTDRLDASLINQFSDELGAGNSDLAQVTARISQISGG